MMTLTAPVAPEHATGDPTNFVTVWVNLLPDEVVAARRARRWRLRVLSGLAALLVVLVGCYGLSSWQTHRAQDELATAQAHAEELAQQQRQYGPLITAQARAAAINSTLRSLMAGDVRWSALLHTLRARAPEGVEVTSVAATMDTTATAPGATGGGAGVLNQTGQQQTGTLTITGSAPDPNAIARYVDALGTIRGLAVPLPATVTGDKGARTFSLTVILTTDVLGGRYTPSDSSGTNEGK